MLGFLSHIDFVFNFNRFEDLSNYHYEASKLLIVISLVYKTKLNLGACPSASTEEWARG